MTLRPPRFLPWLLGGLLLALAGSAWIARDGLQQQREAFDTDARIAHRLLSQQTVQHDAMLATLALLQPGEVDGTRTQSPEQRLPALYPQVLRVLKRERDAAWPGQALQAAEATSRQRQRAVLAEADLSAGHYTVLRAAEPASYALQIDLTRLVPWNEWPMRRDGPVRVLLRWGDQLAVLQPGDAHTAANAGPWRFAATKTLAAESQPFELVATRSLGWAQLPWALMATWALGAALATAALRAATSAWQRQRRARRRAEELLRLGQVGRLNAMGELAAGMAHELNQPLTAVLANTQAAARLLADEPPDLDTARHAMVQAAQQARRASEVLGRLRQVVQRPDSTSATDAVLTLADAARKVLYLLEPDCARRGIAPELRVAADVPAVQADPVALEQIVHNLLTNALQALDQVPTAERTLMIHIGPAAGGAALTVRDSGPGIAAADLPHLFTPFYTTRRDGLGLGLSLCETLAAGMGGQLSGANHAPRGAEFVLR
ncbi:MAG: ATP-binding protein, partial [Burkholderiales bacterium]